MDRRTVAMQEQPTMISEHGIPPPPLPLAPASSSFRHGNALAASRRTSRSPPRRGDEASALLPREGGAGLEPTTYRSRLEGTVQHNPVLPAVQFAAEHSVQPAKKVDNSRLRSGGGTGGTFAEVANIKAQIRQAAIHSTENPANFHQAACVFLLGGKEGGERKSKFPRPEQVSRMTRAEMALAWEIAEGTVSKNEVLVSHFTSIASAGLILGVNSPGFRASTVGQGGGGFFVCNVGPHELEWEQYQGGSFRERTGRELWGENWKTLLVGGADEDKVEMVFFLKVPASWMASAAAIPGRDLAKSIPLDLLYEQDGFHWLQKERIVKSYVLLRNTPGEDVKIEGEGPPPESSLWTKLLFAFLSLSMVMVQILAVTAITFNVMYPSCGSNLQCSRPGTFCAPLGTATRRGSQNGGRCVYCSINAQQVANKDVWLYSKKAGVLPACCLSSKQDKSAWAARQLPLSSDDDTYNPSFLYNITAHPASFCANSSFYQPEHCDASNGWGAGTGVLDQSTGQPTCRNPVCSACPSDPGWNAVPMMGPRWKSLSDNRWGTLSWSETVTGNMQTMQTSDLMMMVLATAVVSFALADEIRDINLCLITIESRIGNCPPWQPRDWMVVVTTFVLGWVVWEILDSYFEFPIVWMVVEFRTSGLMVVPMLMLLLAVWSVDMRHGNSAWRIYLLFVATLRQYVVVPALAAAAPTLAMFDSANAKDIGLNVLGTLFLLQIDNDAFACALPDKMRRHVLAFGRAEIGEAESRRISVATSWSWPRSMVP